MLYHLGHYENRASIKDIAHIAGISEGAVEAFTARCFIALQSYHNQFVQYLTQADKEVEKAWVKKESEVEAWQDG